MNTTTEKFMRIAIQLAFEGMRQGKGGPFGAVIVKNDKIVGRGQNQVTSLNDSTAHAEIQAIRDACKNLNTFDLQDCEIYLSCEPCPMCFGAIYWARLKKVYYAADQQDAMAVGFDDKHIYAEIPKAMAKRQIKFEQILQKEAIMAFNEWQSMTDKTPY